MSNRISEMEAAKYLQMSRSTFWRLRDELKVPYVKLGARRFYEKEQLDAYVNSCRVNYIEKTNATTGLNFEDKFN